MLRQEKMDFARQAAADGMVLLKNDGNLLPLEKSKKIALFGINSYRCFRLGWGSGDMLAQKIIQINEGLLDAGYTLDDNVQNACLKWVDEHNAEYATVNRNWDEWTFRFNEIKLDKYIIDDASKNNDVAIVTIGRCSGSRRI